MDQQRQNGNSHKNLENYELLYQCYCKRCDYSGNDDEDTTLAVNVGGYIIAVENLTEEQKRYLMANDMFYPHRT